MYGNASIMTDYSVDTYYCVYLDVEIDKNGVNSGYNGTGTCNAGGAATWVVLPYDSNAEYDVISNSRVDCYFNDPGLGYIDIYDFIDYLSGQFVIHPGLYQFTGTNGSTQYPSFPQILLGITNAVWTQGGASTLPHHLTIYNDDTITNAPACFSKKRTINYQVRDSSERRTGTIPIVETLHTIPGDTEFCPANDCPTPPQYYCPPGVQNTNLPGGRFTDILSVSCPEGSGSCGFPTDTSKWWFAPRNRPRILVNGSADIPDGTVMPK
jgi:hypothetical protein